MIIGDGVILGGCGESATIVVNAPTGSTVTMSHGGKVTTGTEVSGTWTFKAREYGTYTVTATQGSKTTTKTVVVDAATEYAVPLAFVAPADGVLLTASGVVGDGVATECTFSGEEWTVPSVGGETITLSDGVIFGENTTTICFDSAKSKVNASAVTVYIDGQSLGSKQWYASGRNTTYAIPVGFLDGEPHTITITRSTALVGVKTFTSAYFDV